VYGHLMVTKCTLSLFKLICGNPFVFVFNMSKKNLFVAHWGHEPEIGCQPKNKSQILFFARFVSYFFILMGASFYISFHLSVVAHHFL